MQKRKNRPAQRTDSSRSQPPPPQQQQPQKRTVAADGVYNNPIFIHAVSSQLGNKVHLQTKSGAIYEGIFTTFSPQFNVLLEMAHRVEKDNDNINVETVVEKYIFKPSDIVSMVAKDVDPEFATRDTFEIDTAISSRYNGTRGMETKQLERWDSTGDALDTMCLELDSNANGWDADEMFQKNEAMYGVQSTFDHSLAGYTMQIQKSDSHDFRKAELEAEKIAREIESQTLYDERADLENGDEEALFSAVVRPQGQSSYGGHNNNNNSGGSSNNSNLQNSSKSPATTVVSNASQKYVPPAKRKQGQLMGKLITPQTPPANATAGGAPGAAMNSSSQPTTPQSVTTPSTPPPTVVLTHGSGGGGGMIGGKGGHPGKGGYNATGTPRDNSGAPQYAAGPPPPQQQQQQQSINPNVHSNSGPQMTPISSNAYNNNSQGAPPPGPPPQQPQQQPPQGNINGDMGPGQTSGPPPNVANNQNNNSNNMNNQSSHNSHPAGGGMGPNQNHQKVMGPQHHHQQQHQQPQPRHRSYAPQSHLPPNMAMPPHSSMVYASDVPPPQAGMGPPPQMVLKGQPPPQAAPQHTIMVVPPGGQPQGQLLVVQGIAGPPPGSQKMMNPMPQRPPRGRDETVQDLKNFQDNYVLAGHPNAPSPGLTTGPPPPHQQQQQPPPQQFGHPQSVYVPPPQQQQGQQQQQQQQNPSQGDDMKSQVGGVPSQQPPTGAPIHQGPPPPQPGPSPSPMAGTGTTPTGQQQQDNSNSSSVSTPSASTGGAGEKHPQTEPKKSVLNPQAKSFIPRNPSTPNPSRPHTPQSAGAPPMVQAGAVQTMQGAPNGGPAPPQYQPAYLMQTQKSFPGNRMRYAVPQSAVQAATGSPITLPYMYSGHHPQHFPAQPYSMIRMFTSDAAAAQQQMQYLTPSPHSATPSPGTQYHPQPSPAGGGPSQPFPQAPGQQPQFPTMLCPMIAPQQMVGQFHPNGPQQYSNPFILMQTPHPNQ